MWQNVNNQNNQSETFGAETFLQPISNSQQPPGTPAASQEMHIFLVVVSYLQYGK